MRRAQLYRYLGLTGLAWFLGLALLQISRGSTANFNTIVTPLTKVFAARGSIYHDYVGLLKDIGKAELIPPQLVVSPSEKAINLGFIIVNPNKSPSMQTEFKRRTMETITNMLLHANQHTPLHFIICTDQFSRFQTAELLVSTFSKILAMEVIKHKTLKRHLPPLSVSLVDIKEIVALNPEFVNEFMKFKPQKTVDLKDKYRKEFFYIAPFYHKAFTSLKRFIFMDSSDLEFKSDIGELNAEFENLEKSNAVIGMGLDLSPYYSAILKKYNLLWKSKLGQPGNQQGLNSGVVLFDLERMRNSTEYNKYCEAEEMVDMFHKYFHQPSLGDQDWFTDVGFENPDLFYILPCQFNAQTTLQYMNAEYKDVFDEYHFCDELKNIKIVHLNGCGPLPSNCGNLGDPDQYTTKLYKGGYFFFTEFNVDWMYFAQQKWKQPRKQNVVRIQGMDVIMN